MQGILLTDLDGTLFNSDRTISESNLGALHSLGEMATLRVIATGRSLYSALKALPPQLPIEYLIFSSGAGILDWSTKQVIHATNMDLKDVDRLKRSLIQKDHDFFIQCPIPDNHYFYYHRSSVYNKDFERRLTIYNSFKKNSISIENRSINASQVIAILPDNDLHIYNDLRDQFASVKTIRTTSPLDHLSMWIEFFHPAVSKANAARWLLKKLDMNGAGSLAIGNDYNDEDMLNWAAHSYVLKNGPAPLKIKYRSVADNDEDGFSEAVNNYMEKVFQK